MWARGGMNVGGVCWVFNGCGGGIALFSRRRRMWAQCLSYNILG